MPTTRKGTELTLRRERPDVAGRYIFRCACGWAASRDAQGWWVTYPHRGSPSFGLAIDTGDAWFLLNTERNAVTPCPQCSKRAVGRRVVGTTTAHECDPRCMGATGPRCECSCGGANHGGSFGGVSFSC